MLAVLAVLKFTCVEGQAGIMASMCIQFYKKKI